MAKSALIVVDMQNDFLPGGALGVALSDDILPLINHLLELPFEVRVASMDFHPPHHCSFASTWEKKPGERIMVGSVLQTLWPDHCVQQTFGAEFSSKLAVEHIMHVVHKGVESKVDSYSIFFDNRKLRTTGLEEYLRKNGVVDLYFAGLTTEYCVLYSVLDAIALGFKTHVIIDACRGIDLERGDVESALRVMVESGAELLSTDQVIKRFS